MTHFLNRFASLGEHNKEYLMLRFQEFVLTFPTRKFCIMYSFTRYTIETVLTGLVRQFFAKFLLIYKKKLQQFKPKC